MWLGEGGRLAQLPDAEGLDLAVPAQVAALLTAEGLDLAFCATDMADEADVEALVAYPPCPLSHRLGPLLSVLLLLGGVHD